MANELYLSFHANMFYESCDYHKVKHDFDDVLSKNAIHAISIFSDIFGTNRMNRDILAMTSELKRIDLKFEEYL